MCESVRLSLSDVDLGGMRSVKGHWALMRGCDALMRLITLLER